DWIMATPATPHAAASQTKADGRIRSSGQDRNATQIGNVLVSVRTSEVGNWASAKKVQSRLALLAQLRSHSAPGQRNTSSAPASRAMPSANTKARLLRASATTRQSHVSFSRWANWLIQAVKKQPHTIHRY